MNIPTIQEYFAADADNPTVFGVYRMASMPGPVINDFQYKGANLPLFGYVVAVSADKGEAWVKGFSAIVPDGEEGSISLAAIEGYERIEPTPLDQIEASDAHKAAIAEVCSHDSTAVVNTLNRAIEDALKGRI